MNIRSVICCILLWLSCCTKHESKVMLEYNGPLQEAADVDMIYTEKDRLKLKMKAKKILEFKNGDQEFPEGLYLEFFDEFGNMTSTLRANHAFYFKEKNEWRGLGNVEVKNIQKNQQLNTEELFWRPASKKIFTEKFVNIKLDNEVIYGTGLDAAEDLSSYTIKKPEGEFEVNG